MAKSKKDKSQTKSGISQTSFVKKRKTFLNVWLWIMLVLDLIVAVFYLAFNSTAASLAPQYSSGLLYVYGLIALLNAVMVVLLLKWTKWPFFVLCGTSLVLFAINFSIGWINKDVGHCVNSFLGLVGLGILYLAMRPQWKLFK